jgi:uncharacterized protein YndB with AHSA1/START domain
MPKGTDLPRAGAGLTLVVRRLIHASPERLFDAWTQPARLLRWWGPPNVVCTAADVDLRVGGRYRIANQFPDGSLVWISGQFERIERPTLLVYSWRLGAEQSGAQQAGAERVTVEFKACEASTEVIVTHERIPDAANRSGHEQGWLGCLQGLEIYLRQGT